MSLEIRFGIRLFLIRMEDESRVFPEEQLPVPWTELLEDKPRAGGISESGTNSAPAQPYLLMWGDWG